MKDNGDKINSMGMENLYFQIKMYIKEIFNLDK